MSKNTIFYRFSEVLHEVMDRFGSNKAEPPLETWGTWNATKISHFWLEILNPKGVKYLRKKPKTSFLSIFLVFEAFYERIFMLQRGNQPKILISPTFSENFTFLSHFSKNIERDFIDLAKPKKVESVLFFRFFQLLSRIFNGFYNFLGGNPSPYMLHLNATKFSRIFIHY